MPSTKRTGILFLQVGIVLVGIGAFAVMLWEPHLEGRNAHATNFEIYFKDPFLAYAYTASIAFFVALYQAFRLLGYVARNQVVSQNAVRTLQIIKYCAMTLVMVIGAAVAYLFVAVRGKDDIAGGVAVGFAMSLISLVIATVAARYQRRLQDAIDTKRKNDLSV